MPAWLITDYSILFCEPEQGGMGYEDGSVVDAVRGVATGPATLQQSEWNVCGIPPGYLFAVGVRAEFILWIRGLG